MAAKTVLNYLDRDSVVHKMTGTTKLAFFLLFTFASMITYNTWVLLGLFAVSLATFKLSKIKYREVRFMMIFMLVFLLLNNLFIFLFDPNQGTNLYGTRHVLCHLFWRYDVTAEQLFYMLNISLKYFVALPVAILFISATNPSEFAASLNSIGISYKVGYSVAIALRYIPDIQRDYHSISQAQQARGVELGKNEMEYFGRGVSFCAVCDANFYKGQSVCVASKNGSGVKAALELANVCSKVIVLDSGDLSNYAKANKNDKIDIFSDVVIEKIEGKEIVQYVVIKSGGETRKIETSALFIELGKCPKTNLFKNVLELDKNGFIVTDEHMRTSAKGVFAVGDVRNGVLKQIVTACNDGAIAGQLAYSFNG